MQNTIFEVTLPRVNCKYNAMLGLQLKIGYLSVLKSSCGGSSRLLSVDFEVKSCVDIATLRDASG